MRTPIAIITGIITAIIIIFYIDPKIVNYVLSLVPVSANEWLGLIKLVVWIFLVSATLGITAYISLVIGSIFAFLYETITDIILYSGKRRQGAKRRRIMDILLKK